MGQTIGDCFTGGENGTSGCYSTAVNGSQIVVGMIINLCIGLLCYPGFVLWRGSFRIYFSRLVSPEVLPGQRPPPLRLGGHWQLWSWLIPVFTVSDGELLEKVGLDALVAQRIIGFGFLMLLPLAVLGVGVLLPLNYTFYDPTTVTTTDTTTNTTNTDTISNTFLRMTMSSVPTHSRILWVHFFFTYFFIAWVCWLVIRYYKEFISLRQAHDQRLIDATDISRRVSLLDERSQAGQGQPQIMDRRRTLRVLSLQQRRSTMSDLGGEAGGGSAPAAFAGPDAALGSTGSSPTLPPPNPHLGSSTLARRASVTRAVPRSGASLDGGGGLPRIISSKAGSVPSELLDTSSGDVAGSRLVHHHPASHAIRSSLDGDTVGGGAMMPSPFEDRTARPARPVRPDALQRITDATEAPAGTDAGDDVEAQEGGDGDRDGVPAWDELEEPLLLVNAADAAQFYTVLVMDEAIESFAYRHEDAPWLLQLPSTLHSTLASTPRAMGNLVSKGKRWFHCGKTKEKDEGPEDAEAGTEQWQEGKGKDSSSAKDVERCHHRMQVAEDLFSEIFGEDFDRIVPVYNTKAADVLLQRWFQKRLLLDRLLLQQRKLREKQAQLRADVAARLEEADRQLAELEAAARDVEDQQEQAEVPLRVQHSQQEERQQPEQEEEEAMGDAEVANGGSSPSKSKQAHKLSGDLLADAPVAAATAGGWRSRLCLQPKQLTVAQQEQRAERLKVELGKVGDKVAAAERALADLQGSFEVAQQEAAEAQPAPCFFATFHTAHAAAYAARLNLNPLHERMMRVMPAPAPRNVNYTTLCRSWASRGFRPIPVFVAVLVMLLIPIGLFAGICGTIVASICGTNPDGSTTLSAYGSWFCSDSSFAGLLRSLVSSTLPAILLSVWQAVVLPAWFYNCAQSEAQHVSLSELDLRCARLFFLHNFFNVFLGGMLGGSIVWGLRAIIHDPSQFFTILGEAVPASSNFFISYVSYRALGMAAFRLFFPHAAVFGSILKWLRIVPSPKTERGIEAAAVPISCRYSRDLGVLQLTIILVVLGYGVVTPIILPFGLLYFAMWWPIWRYQMLYVFQAHYDSHGYYWVYTAHRVVVCLGVMASFTAAILAVKGAYVQALVLFFTAIAFLWWFDRYLTFRYDNVVDQAPAVGIHHAPRARVDDTLYVPAPMQHRGAGWHPEWGKASAWVGYGVPRYGL